MQLVRGHKEGSLYRHPTRPVWVAAISLPDGRRRRRQAPTRGAALVELRKLQTAITAEAIDATRIRLGDYLERWVSDEHALAPATHRKHKTIIRTHLIPRLGHLRMSEMRTQDVGGALADIGRTGLDPQTVRHVRSTLRRALADAVRDGLVSRNVAALAEPPKLPNRERVTLDATQARLLIDSTRGTPNVPLRTNLVTTGLRISEALGLAWSDVALGGNNDAPARVGTDQSVGASMRVRRRGVPVPRLVSDHPEGVPSITVRRGLQRVSGEWQLRPPKTAKGRRTIPLTPLGVEALRQRREDQAADRGATVMEGLVFTTSTGHPIHATNLLPRLRADLAAAGLPKVGLHDLRHSAATILFSVGVPIEVIADILGHSTVRVTQDLYRHRIPEMSVDAAKRMQEALA